MSGQLSFDEPDVVFDAARAAQAAVRGMEQANRAERVQLWKQGAAAWLAALEPGALVTADDLVAAIGLPDSGVARNNVVGAFFSGAAKAGRLRFTGKLVRSERVIGHGNLQRQWEAVRL